MAFATEAAAILLRKTSPNSAKKGSFRRAKAMVINMKKNLLIIALAVLLMVVTTFTGVHAVMAWNDSYASQILTPETESIEADSKLPLELEVIEADSNIVVVDAELVQQIAVGMTNEEVKTILGSTGADVGSGYIIFKYELTNNQAAYIYYIYNDSGELIVSDIAVN